MFYMNDVARLTNHYYGETVEDQIISSDRTSLLGDTFDIDRAIFAHSRRGGSESRIQ